LFIELCSWPWFVFSTEQAYDEYCGNWSRPRMRGKVVPWVGL
jgi:hypothetical protein